MKSFVFKGLTFGLGAMLLCATADAQLYNNLGEVALQSSSITRVVPSNQQVNYTMPEWEPIEKVNRFMFGLNNTVNNYVFRPIGVCWNYIVPVPARECINNFGNNLNSPFSALQNLLQANLYGAGTEVQRFIINSTAGILGLFDVAAVEPNRQNFANTLGVWGLCPLVHLEVPIIVQTSSLRDFPANVAEGVFKGFCTFGVTSITNIVLLFNNAEKVVDLRNECISNHPNDPYVGVRDTFESKRENRIIESSVGSINPVNY